MLSVSVGFAHDCGLAEPNVKNMIKLHTLKTLKKRIYLFQDDRLCKNNIELFRNWLFILSRIYFSVNNFESFLHDQIQ